MYAIVAFPLLQERFPTKRHVTEHPGLQVETKATETPPLKQPKQLQQINIVIVFFVSSRFVLTNANVHSLSQKTKRSIVILRKIQD